MLAKGLNYNTINRRQETRFYLWEYKRKRYLKRILIYSSNSIATFNPPIFSLILLRSGDIETQPGPVNHTSTDSESSTSKGYRKIKVGHLNVRSLKNRTHLSLVKETVFLHKFDIFTISESWLHKSVSNAELDITTQVSRLIQDDLQAINSVTVSFVNINGRSLTRRFVHRHRCCHKEKFSACKFKPMTMDKPPRQRATVDVDESSTN